MSNKKQGFSRNLQQEQKEFERKAKQAPAKENKEKQKSNPGNKETNSSYEQSNHYQKKNMKKGRKQKFLAITKICPFIMKWNRQNPLLISLTLIRM